MWIVRGVVCCVLCVGSNVFFVCVFLGIAGGERE